MSDTRERVAQLLKANGEAGSVECDPDGSPVFQYFVAQAGPFDEGTPVVVLGQKEADKLLSLLDGEPVAIDPDYLDALREALKWSADEMDISWTCDLAGLLTYLENTPLYLHPPQERDHEAIPGKVTKMHMMEWSNHITVDRDLHRLEPGARVTVLVPADAILGSEERGV